MFKKQHLLFLSIFTVLVLNAPIYFNLHCQENKEATLRKPILKNGQYYYSENDTHNHMQRALTFLPRKVLRAVVAAPQKLITKITSLFTNEEVKKEPEVKLNILLPKPIQTKPEPSCISPMLTWIGHASFLIQVGGFNILTDPVFGDAHAGPFHITSRIMAPGIRLEDLPQIDAIVISHNHADHTDKASLLAIYAKYPNVHICVPEGNKSLFTKWGFKAETIAEKTWWEDIRFTKNEHELILTFLPAKHWSIYINPFGYRKSLWGSWMISCNNANIYFAGDTAYDDHFKQIGNQFNNIDVALLPIAPTHKDPNEHNPCHVNAKEAIEAFIDLGAHCFIPMHYGTFFGGPNSLEYPINLLLDYWSSKECTELNNKKLLLAQCGKAYHVDIAKHNLDQ